MRRPCSGRSEKGGACVPCLTGIGLRANASHLSRRRPDFERPPHSRSPRARPPPGGRVEGQGKRRRRRRRPSCSWLGSWQERPRVVRDPCKREGVREPWGCGRRRAVYPSNPRARWRRHWRHCVPCPSTRAPEGALALGERVGDRGRRTKRRPAALSDQHWAQGTRREGASVGGDKTLGLGSPSSLDVLSPRISDDSHGSKRPAPFRIPLGSPTRPPLRSRY